MTGADYLVVVAYLAGVILMSSAFAWRQRTGDDYFLAGRRMPAWPLAMSIMATQASAVSLIGAPAFVALRERGGLRWLQYELALPLAMLALLATVLPVLRRVPGSSIYAFLEDRFSRGTRRVLASAFVLSRGLALGVILYASAIAVAAALGWSVDAAILAVGVFALVYTGLGGIVADIWSDVLQLGVLWVGVAAAGMNLLAREGGALLRAIPGDRMVALSVGATGIGDGDAFGLWPMLVGGLFLYVSYYGCDQSQAQRVLTARDDRSARRALVWNGLLRFPLVLTYCLFGLLLAGYVRVDAAFAAEMGGRPPDALVPTFMIYYLPAGLRGLLLAAILAAAMSSIDSAMNSLAAVTLEDVARLAPEAQNVWVARGVSFGWGLFAVGSGLAFARSGTGVLELVNQIGSAFYGPVLAVFVLGALTTSVGPRQALCGFAAGLAANAGLALLAPGVSWLWWNPAGFGAAVAGALVVGRKRLDLRVSWPPRWEVVVLVTAFAAMMAVVLALTEVAGAGGQMP